PLRNFDPPTVSIGDSGDPMLVAPWNLRLGANSLAHLRFQALEPRLRECGRIVMNVLDVVYMKRFGPPWIQCVYCGLSFAEQRIDVVTGRGSEGLGHFRLRDVLRVIHGTRRGG